MEFVALQFTVFPCNDYSSPIRRTHSSLTFHLTEGAYQTVAVLRIETIRALGLPSMSMTHRLEAACRHGDIVPPSAFARQPNDPPSSYGCSNSQVFPSTKRPLQELQFRKR